MPVYPINTTTDKVIIIRDMETEEWKGCLALEPIIDVNLSIEPENATAYHFVKPSVVESFTAKFSVKNFYGFSIFVLTGNDLYLRFPKKLRRKRNIPHLFDYIIKDLGHPGYILPAEDIKKNLEGNKNV